MLLYDYWTKGSTCEKPQNGLAALLMTSMNMLNTSTKGDEKPRSTYTIRGSFLNYVVSIWDPEGRSDVPTGSKRCLTESGAEIWAEKQGAVPKSRRAISSPGCSQ
jgi:hypothetical protein